MPKRTRRSLISSVHLFILRDTHILSVFFHSVVRFLPPPENCLWDRGEVSFVLVNFAHEVISNFSRKINKLGFYVPRFPPPPPPSLVYFSKSKCCFFLPLEVDFPLEKFSRRSKQHRFNANFINPLSEKRAKKLKKKKFSNSKKFSPTERAPINRERGGEKICKTFHRRAINPGTNLRSVKSSSSSREIRNKRRW